MKKYFNVFTTSLRQESKTVANSITCVISFVVIIYIFKQLWQFIYGGSGVGTLINGYTLNMMIWYMIMAEILMYAVYARATTRNFSNDIKSGKIAYMLNKPYNYYFYRVCASLGDSFWRLLFLIPTAVIMGLILLGPIEAFKAVYIFPILLSLFLGTILTSIMFGGVGLLAFWIEEATPFTWIIQKFQMLFGLFFPPEFFPSWLSPIITYSPVYAMISGPSKLLANFSWELFGNVFVSQISWITIVVAISLIIYKIGTKKVNVYGG